MAARGAARRGRDARACFFALLVGGACAKRTVPGSAGAARESESESFSERANIRVDGSNKHVPLSPAEIKEAFHEPSVVMKEVQRLQAKDLAKAVGAIVDGTSKIALGYEATSTAISLLADHFADAMRGELFLGTDDTPRPENVRFRRALFVAGCASLAAQARARADEMQPEQDLSEIDMADL